MMQTETQESQPTKGSGFSDIPILERQQEASLIEIPPSVFDGGFDSRAKTLSGIVGMNPEYVDAQGNPSFMPPPKEPVPVGLFVVLGTVVFLVLFTIVFTRKKSKQTPDVDRITGQVNKQTRGRLTSEQRDAKPCVFCGEADHSFNECEAKAEYQAADLAAMRAEYNVNMQRVRNIVSKSKQLLAEIEDDGGEKRISQDISRNPSLAG